jgi:hypothetical protein
LGPRNIRSSFKNGSNQRRSKRTFAEFEKWLNNSKKEIKKMSAYLLECQVVVNSQFFQAHHKEVLKYRTATLRDTTMLSDTLTAAWRIRDEILKLEVARLPEKYQDLAWSLVRRIYSELWVTVSSWIQFLRIWSKLQTAMLSFGIR